MNSISVIVPLFNEEETVGHLYSELREVMLGFGREYELVFVDDGSREENGAVAEGDREGRSNVQVISSGEILARQRRWRPAWSTRASM